jgi:hypothetical protein
MYTPNNDSVSTDINRFVFQFFLFFILSLNGYGQKAVKGNSAANPWNKEIDDGHCIFKGNNDTNEMFSELKYGNWSFKADYPDAQSFGLISDADPGWNLCASNFVILMG